DCNMGYVREAEAALPEAIRDGHARKAGPVLDATKALLLGGRDETPVLDETRRSTGVESIDPNNIHWSECKPNVKPRRRLALHRTRALPTWNSRQQSKSSVKIYQAKRCYP